MGAQPQELTVWHFMPSVAATLHGYLQKKLEAWQQLG